MAFMVVQTAELREALERWLGFPSFRPSQEPIVCDVLAGRDAFALLPDRRRQVAVLPTPGAARDGLTVVISPLIALMKDQVDALEPPASARPRSTVRSMAGVRSRLEGLERGEYKLLYVAPERLMLAGFLRRS